MANISRGDNSSRNKLRTVTSSDFEHIKTRYNNESFKEMIPQLCLADMLLVEFYKSVGWKKFITIYNAHTFAYACNICPKYIKNAFDLYTHLNCQRHTCNFSCETKPEMFYHPVFTNTLKEDIKTLESDNKIKENGNNLINGIKIKQEPIEIEDILKKAENALLEMSRQDFLYVYTAAKIYENKIQLMGIPLNQSTTEFSGKKIVESATKIELDEAKRKLQSDAQQALEERKLFYNELLNEAEKRCKYVEEKTLEGKSTGKVVKVHTISMSDRDKINNFRMSINSISGKNILSQNPFENFPKRHTREGVSSKATPESNVITVLRLFAGLEDDLGSMGSKLINLLSHTLTIRRKFPDKNLHLEVLSFENCLLIRTAVERLKGVIEILQETGGPKVNIIYDVIQKAKELLKYIPGGKFENDNDDVEMPSQKESNKNSTQVDDSKEPKPIMESIFNMKNYLLCTDLLKTNGFNDE